MLKFVQIYLFCFNLPNFRFFRPDFEPGQLNDLAEKVNRIYDLFGIKVRKNEQFGLN